MSSYAFETVDVFTDRAFGGNPLAVFTDARGLDTATMQALAAEINYSETAFVLPADDAANDARVRIFNRTAEMPFAGHPSIGTACVIARQRGETRPSLRLELPAGIVEATLSRDHQGQITGALIAAPQPLSTGAVVDPAAIARCLGIAADAVITAAHPPMEVSVGVQFVVAEVTETGLAIAVPDAGAFAAARLAMGGDGDRLSLLVYARQDDQLHVRMFAPLSGTVEDPATGSANAALAALLVSIDGSDSGRFIVRQGAEMGRPSLLHTAARRTALGITATVAGGCVAMFSGAWSRQTTG